MKSNHATWIMPLLAALLGALYLWPSPPAPESQPMQPVGALTIAASRTLSPALIWVAQEQGLFARAGLQVEVREYPSGKATTEAMLKGESDLSASAEFLATRLSFTHPELRLLGTTAFVHEIKLLVLKGRGIASPGDLKGKRIGVRLGTNGDYFLARLLTLNGLQRSDIEWVDMAPQAMADALAEGTVDGVIIWPPMVQKIEARLGDQLLSFDGQPGQDYYYLLLTRSEWLEAHPLQAERVMLALHWAEAWLQEHPQEGLDYMASRFGLERQTMADTLRGYRLSVTLSQSLLVAMESEARWLEEQGHNQGRRVENFLDLIDPAPLKAVAPGAVTLVH